MGKEGAYARMVQLQQSPAQNQTSTSQYFTSESGMGSKEINQSPSIAPHHSISAPSPYYTTVVSSKKVENLQVNDFNDYKRAEKSPYPEPSTWRMLKVNAPEWKRTLLGCLGAAVYGALAPINVYCLGSVGLVYFSKNNSKIKSDMRIYAIVFLTLGVMCFFSNILQHYNLGIMGERLTKRVREKLLANMLTFEIGWFDQDENRRAAICARLATEANMVRSLLGDRASLFIHVSVGATFAFVVGLVITWRVALVMIAMQPLIIGSLYSRVVLNAKVVQKI